MPKFKTVALAGIMLIFTVAVIYKYSGIFSGNKDANKEVHYHAGFVVFNDKLREDFSDLKYMVLKPCEIEQLKEKRSPEEIQLDKAHLHAGVGDVLHVHVEGAKWGDLFTNLKYDLNYADATGYINGKKTTDFQNLPINSNDSLVLFVGSVDETLLSQAVTAARIKEIDQNTVECGGL